MLSFPAAPPPPQPAGAPAPARLWAGTYNRAMWRAGVQSGTIGTVLRRAGGLGAALVACIALGSSVVPARAVDFPRPNPVANGSFDAPRVRQGAPPTDSGVTPFWYAAVQGTARFVDVDGDGDREAVIDAAPPTA